MVNYQLYRTNVLLGGQLTWDLILSKENDSNLVIDGFQLSPISQKVPFNHFVQNDLTNYSHQYNIKSFYQKISGSFFKTYADKKLYSLYPIIQNDITDTHDDTYEMGCKRMNYSLYKKQFEFFIPLWLENIKDDDKLFFKIKINTGNNTIASKRLIISSKNDKYKFHNKFIKYWNNYINYINLPKGNNEILSVQFDKGLSFIKGINVETGEMVNKKLPNLVKNLVHREIPLMDFDNLLISEFMNNKIITSQLFNFRLCFNPEDICTYNTLKLIRGKRVNYIIESGVIRDNKEILFELKDFYSNYDFIAKKYCGYPYVLKFQSFPTLDNLNAPIIGNIEKNDKNEQYNVLSYLQDYKYISNIDKNKINQPIIHWSLLDNNDYILNLYDGFSGYIEDGDNKIFLSHIYGNTPKTGGTGYSSTLNNTGWCNLLMIPEIKLLESDNADVSVELINDKIKNYIKNTLISNLISKFHSPEYKKYSSKFGEKWTNNIQYDESDIKYNILLVLDKSGFENESMRNWTEFKTNGVDYYELSNKSIAFIKQRDKELYFLIASNDNNELILHNIINNLSNITADEYKKEIDNLKNILKSAKSVPLITSPASLNIEKADSPSLSSTEIQYYKSDNPGSYLLRYSGSIRPSFISKNDDEFNYIYFKEILKYNNEENQYQDSPYQLYKDTGYQAKYPSIGYFPFKKEKAVYNKEDISSSLCLQNNIINKIEYKFFENNMYFCLDPEINFEIESNDEFIEENIKNELFKYYDFSISDDIKLYIYNMYNVQKEINYKKEDTVNINYKVKLILK